jgi:hypothetical protein
VVCTKEKGIEFRNFDRVDSIHHVQGLDHLGVGACGDKRDGKPVFTEDSAHLSFLREAENQIDGSCVLLHYLISNEHC